MVIFDKKDKTLAIPVGVYAGSDCSELEEKVIQLTSQIEEKDAEIAQLEEDVRTAFDNGVADQKAKLRSKNITANGTYTREDGWNEITVNTPSAETELLDYYLCVKSITLNTFDPKRYKYLSSYCVPSMQYSVTAAEGDDIFIFENDGTRTHLTDSGSFLSNRECLIWVMSNNANWQSRGFLSGTVANFYSGHIGNATPKFQRVNLYFTPSNNIDINPVNEEIRFYQKDKPHIGRIYDIAKTKFYFPIGADLDDLRAQYPDIKITLF